jgi:hypothetical protein
MDIIHVGSRELQHLYVNTTFQVERNGNAASFTFSTIGKAMYVVWPVVLVHGTPCLQPSSWSRTTVMLASSNPPATTTRRCRRL